MDGTLGITALPIEGELATVEVVGLDPATHSNDATVAAWLRELLWQHGVLCIRLNAKLDDDDMRAMVQLFGPIKDPVGHDEALAMLDSLRGARLLDGVRGRPAVERAAIVDIIVAIGRLGIDRPDIGEIDLNPVIAGPDGALAVDALVVLS